jgi:hypothetical protein
VHLLRSRAFQASLAAGTRAVSSVNGGTGASGSGDPSSRGGEQSFSTLRIVVFDDDRHRRKNNPLTSLIDHERKVLTLMTQSRSNARLDGGRAKMRHPKPG